MWKLLNGFADDIAHRTGLRFSIKRVLVRSLAKKRDIDFPEGVLTDRVEDVLDDPEISIVLEFLGGEEPAHQWITLALERGKTVVTANKVAFALHWHELQKAAKQSGAGLYYEAAVCGAIPIIHTLEESLQANRISYIYGIVNGTTNYILTRMSKERRGIRRCPGRRPAPGPGRTGSRQRRRGAGCCLQAQHSGQSGLPRARAV